MFEVGHENGLVRRFRWKHERRKPTWPKKQKESTLCIVESRNPNIGKIEWEEEIYHYEECSLTDQFNKAEGRKRSLAWVLAYFPRSYRLLVWKKYFELFPFIKKQKYRCSSCRRIFNPSKVIAREAPETITLGEAMAIAIICG